MGRLLALAGILLVSGGILLAAFTVHRYQPLDTETMRAAVPASYLAFALIAFVAIPRPWYAGSQTPWAARVGLAVAASAGLWSCILAGLAWINGAGTHVSARDVAWIDRRVVVRRGNYRIYEVIVKPWPASQRAVTLGIQPEQYRALEPGRSVRLLIGAGRLGVEWLQRVEVGNEISDPDATVST